MTTSLRRALLVLALTLAALLAAPAGAATGDPRCKALRDADFTATRDAPFKIVSAAVADENGAAPYCKLTGYVQPEISFEMRLPVGGWNRGFVLVGSGGWASRRQTSLCRVPLARGYACIAGDAGQQFDQGLWMQGNAQAKIDWGYRATHVVTLAGKALTQAYYGMPPALSLMMGCSTGGYQGLVEAQRFPWDFAGILAFGPDIDEGDLSMRTAWAARNLVDTGGRSMFSSADLDTLHRAVLAVCDGNDGIRDGIVGDPVACRFDPRTVQCRDGKREACLSPRQVAAAARIYGGPVNSAGERLSTMGPFPGSERNWPDILEDVRFAQDYFRFALADSPRDGFSADRFDFDQDYKRLGLGGTFISSNPDLRRFRQAGGKLVIVQGSNDVTEQAHAAIDYYEMVERVAGSSAAAREFARLFVVPGMNHCSGGDGAFAADWFGALERWAREGKAPDVVIGAHVPDWTDGNVAIAAGITAPTPGMAVSFTRPHYPYPLHARYGGHGDVDDARSFRPSPPRRD